MAYIDGSGNYYEGDRQGDDAIVPARPSAAHVWNGDAWAMSSEKLRALLLADLRARRDLAMNVLDGLQSDALADGDITTARDIKAAKQACRDIPALDVSAATTETQMRALYLTEWRRIVLLVPSGVRSAFAAVLA